MKMSRELYSLGVSEAKSDAARADREHEFMLEYEEWWLAVEAEERQLELRYEEGM